MTRTERLLALATQRGDRASIAILEGPRRVAHEAECYAVDANPFLVCDECIEDRLPLTFGRTYAEDRSFVAAALEPRCTVPTGIASRPFCGGTREGHATWDGPFHAFDNSSRELPSTERWVDSGNGVFVNVGQ